MQKECGFHLSIRSVEELRSTVASKWVAMRAQVDFLTSELPLRLEHEPEQTHNFLVSILLCVLDLYLFRVLFIC